MEAEYNTATLKVITPWAFICVSVVALTAIGTFRLFDGGQLTLADFICLQDAGNMWLRGENPYLSGAGPDNCSFAYPPTSAIFFMLFGAIPYEISKVLYLLANYLALGGVIHLALKNFAPDFEWSKLRLIEATGISILIASPPVGAVFSLGQTSIIILLFAMLSWHFYQKDKLIPAAIFLALATIKPQFSIFLILWLILNLRIKLLLLSGAFGVALLAPLLLYFSPIEIFEDWFYAMTHYQSYYFNRWGFQDVAGVQSLLAAAGIDTLSLAPIGFCLLLVLFMYKEKVDEQWLLPLFMILSFSFLFVHDTDYSGLIPVWIGAMMFATKNPRWIAPVATLVIFFHLPQLVPRRLFDIEYMDHNPIMHWRTLVVLALGAIVIYWNFQASKK